MKLEKWALMSEIVGAAAIVVSLAFVGVQLKANTSARPVTALENRAICRLPTM